MFFARHNGSFGSPFGILPITAGVKALGPSAQISTGLATLADNTCTSDDKMMWSQGAWRVVGTADDASKCVATVPQVWTDVVTQYLETAGHQYFVGPFPIQARLLIQDYDYDNDNNIEITTIDDPKYIPKEWLPAIKELLASAAKSQQKLQQLTLSDQLPVITGPSRPSPNDPSCNVLPNGQCDLLWNWDGHPYIDNTGTTWFRQKDADGISRTYVKRGDDLTDTNSYRQLQFYDWWDALKLTGNEWPAIDYGISLTRDNMTQWQSQYDPTAGVNVTPVAKWKHPKTGDMWGLWLALVPMSTKAGTSAVWDSKIDQPPWATVLQIGFGPIPQEPWYDEALDVLAFIPATILDATAAVVEFTISAIQDLICSGAPCPGRDPGTQAACAAVKMTCPRPPGVPPPPAVPPPWWQQWYVIVPAIGLLGYLVFNSTKKQTPSASPAT
jgi:hypothetical protein